MIDRDDDTTIEIIEDLIEGPAGPDTSALVMIDRALYSLRNKHGEDPKVAKTISDISSFSRILFSEGRYHGYPGGADAVRTILRTDLIALRGALNRTGTSTSTP